MRSKESVYNEKRLVTWGERMVSSVTPAVLTDAMRGYYKKEPNALIAS